MKRKRVWLTGANGQLGTAIQRTAPTEAPELQIIGTTRKEVDLSSPAEVARFAETHRIDVVVNCVAYTNVDAAERQSADAVYANVAIPHILGSIAQAKGLPLIHVSTDHIFGKGATDRSLPYTEEETPDPANTYGLTKYLGEYALQSVTSALYILRTSWLYSPVSWGHKSFYKSILGKALEGGSLRVVTDEVSAPTSAITLAQVILRIAVDSGTEAAPPYGVYHITDLGEASRHTFAKAIAALHPVTAERTVAECLQSDLQLPAPRPRYSKLDTAKIAQYYPQLFRPWQERLQEVYQYDKTVE
ncbi:MAG: NAD(P)-dependent oxidoreductase [Porphyromonas sp.]|nr:NAD(P)-dependent oxidoreductase [Porphyromonas sp.]